MELKQKYMEFLRNASKKIKPWFELEYKMAQDSEKFIKAQFLKDVLNIWLYVFNVSIVDLFDTMSMLLAYFYFVLL